MNCARLDDEALLTLMARGQDEALSELYDRYGRLVFSIAYNVLGEVSGAEEVAQDTFMRAWEHANSYQSGQGKVATWLASIARHRSIDLFRSRRARPADTGPSLDELDWFDLPGNDNVESQVERNQEQVRVQRAIAMLPADQRQALALAYFRGLTHEEIARDLGQPLGTVKTRIRLAMQKLRLILQDD